MLTEIGILVSSVLLSLGGTVVMISTQLRKSNCRLIKCCGASCVREPMDIDD